MGEGEPLRLERDVRRIAVPRHHVHAPEGLAAAEAYVASELAAAGVTVERQPFLWRGREAANILGTLEGTDPSRPWVIVGAHVDSVAHSPGADDNASGVAAMLEVARLLGSSPRPATIQFVGFALEELQFPLIPPLYKIGSRAYCAWLKDRVARIAGAFILEMVGFTGPRQRAPAAVRLVKRIPRAGRFLAAVADRTSGQLLETLQRAASGVVELVTLEVPLQGFVVPDTRRSDHARFWDVGFPALLITDTAELRNPHYHRASDTPDTLDYRFMAAVATTVARAVADLAGAPEPAGL